MRARRLLLRILPITLLVVVALVAGLTIVGTRLLDYWSPQYRTELAQRLSARIDGRVRIGSLGMAWRWNGPVLELDDVSIVRDGRQQPAVRVVGLGLHFSFLDLARGHLMPDGLVLHGPRLTVQHDARRRLRLVHWTRPNDPHIRLRDIETIRKQLDFVTIENGHLRVLAPQLPNGQAVFSHITASFSKSEQEQWRAEVAGAGPAWGPHVSGHADFKGPLTHLADARITIGAKKIASLTLAQANSLLPAARQKALQGGRLTVHVRSHWHEGRLKEGLARLRFSAVRTAGTKALVSPPLQARITAHAGQSPSMIRFEMAHVEGQVQEKAEEKAKKKILGLAGSTLAGRLDTRTRRLYLNARHIPAALAKSLARIRLAWLEDIHAKGDIDTASVTVGAAGPMKLALDFKGVQVAGPRLSFGPLAGNYYQRGQTHVLQFENAGGTLEAKHYLKGALAVDDLGGSLSWRHSADGLHISLKKLRLGSGKASLRTSGSIDIQKEQAPVVDLKADMQAPDLPRLLAHIPQAADLPNQRLRDWLPKAIGHGGLQSAHLDIAGPLNRFPFAEEKNGAHFKLQITGRGFDVDYKPDWPPLKDARGTLTLEGDNLTARLTGGQMTGVALKPSIAHIANVREPVMHLTSGAGNVQAEKLLAFLTHSPLKKRFGKLARAVDIRGRDDLTVRLRLPLKPGLGHARVNGRIELLDNTFRQETLPDPITGLTGGIAFDDKGLKADALPGKMAEMPIRIKLAPGSGGKERVTAQVRPQLPRDRKILAHYLPAPWLDYADGATSGQVSFNVEKNGTVSGLTVLSDLEGMKIALPAPLNKPATQPAPLKATIAPGAHRVHARYDNRLTLNARIVNGHATRVQALLGDKPPAPPDRDGLWIGGSAARVDGLGWFHVVRHVLHGPKTQGSEDGKNDPLQFLGGDMKIGKLAFGARYFADTYIRADPMHGVRGWRVNLDGPNTKGQVRWTVAPGQAMKIAGNLALLAMGTDKEKSKPKSSRGNGAVLWPGMSPAQLPLFELYVKHFKIDTTHFGEVHLDASQIAHGWQLDRFTLENGALTGLVRARWTNTDGITQAHARVNLRGHELSRFIGTFFSSAPIEAKSTRFDGEFSIAPNTRGLDLNALNGNVEFTLKDGTLLSVNPGASSRLLGLFNLYLLPRRLSLHFRDVTDKGLAFDRLHAAFVLRKGNAYNKDVLIRTASSTIAMQGRIGLAARDYDEHVTIVPKIGSGFALAGTLLGGPLVGAAVFGAQELLKVPIQQATAIRYTLKGSWGNPRVVQDEQGQ